LANLGSFIQRKGSDDHLHGATVRQRRNDARHQCHRFLPLVKEGAGDRAQRFVANVRDIAAFQICGKAAKIINAWNYCEWLV
jgi:hypothetical protein